MTRGVTIKLTKSQLYQIVLQGKVLVTLDEDTTTEISDKLKDMK